ncbi:hypothetical protein J2T13_004489 [Paenibacillus sp. DS2015]|uniref:hypothetical protein n=1 Tax=Paenibacillus sp. DS2015 TaxID=3373917 RepID=UPI003D23982C
MKANRPQASLFSCREAEISGIPGCFQLSKYTFWFRHSAYGQGVTFLASQNFPGLVLVPQSFQTDIELTISHVVFFHPHEGCIRIALAEAIPITQQRLVLFVLLQPGE